MIGCGGGGIPVVEEPDGSLRGVEAVIDKDLASSLLARSIGADLFVLATGVERVAIDFNTPQQRWLDRMTLAEAKRYDAADTFDSGSMGPKVKALIEFLDGGGKRGLITAPGISAARWRAKPAPGSFPEISPGGSAMTMIISATPPSC